MTAQVVVLNATLEPIGVASLQRAVAFIVKDRAQIMLAADGTIRFPDGTMTAPLVSAAEAYRQLDQGDPPPCEGRPKAPGPTIEPGPDGSVSSPVATACVPLTVTAVRLGTAEVRTSRGVADVPAWLFTVEGLAAPVARVAVAPQSVTPVPEPTAPARPAPEGVVGAEHTERVDGTRLTYVLGVGACDTGITPLVQEREDLVVVGGGVRADHVAELVAATGVPAVHLRAPRTVPSLGHRSVTAVGYDTGTRTITSTEQVAAVVAALATGRPG